MQRPSAQRLSTAGCGWPLARAQSSAALPSPLVVRSGEPARSAARSDSDSRIAAVLLAPGAGGSADSPAIVELAGAIEATTGFVADRMDFPYRLAGRRRPDPPAVLEAAVRQRAAALGDRLGAGTAELVLGGRSMGGRICSQAVAAGLPSAGLVLVSYPLHPPGRPERLRTSHFPALDVPCLFVSGTKDAFGTPAELEAATAAIPGPVSHAWLEGGDHGLGKHTSDVAELVVRWLLERFALRGSG